MQKLMKAVTVVMLLGLLSGCNVKDGGGMINPDEAVLDALSGDWTGDDGRWSAAIDGYHITLQMDGAAVLEGTYTLNAPADESADARTALVPDGGELSLDGTVTGTVEGLYLENGSLYMEIAYDEAYAGHAQCQSGTVVFTKAE